MRSQPNLSKKNNQKRVNLVQLKVTKRSKKRQN